MYLDFPEILSSRSLQLSQRLVTQFVFFIDEIFALHPHTTHPLHDTVALDSGTEARYVRRQGRGLGI